MADSFYPFVGETDKAALELEMVEYPARIAVVDDIAAAPRVVVVQPTDVRSYLEEVTATVTKLAAEQGGTIPFTVIREVVENLVHAYFREPTVSILNGGNTIRFSDQGPGIREKEKALQYGTTSATESMKRYIRGVGSGLPYAQQWMRDHGGDLTIEDNISAGTVVTISLMGKQEPETDAANRVNEESNQRDPAAPGWPNSTGIPGPSAPQTADPYYDTAQAQQAATPYMQSPQAAGVSSMQANPAMWTPAAYAAQAPGAAQYPYSAGAQPLWPAMPYQPQAYSPQQYPQAQYPQPNPYAPAPMGQAQYQQLNPYTAGTMPTPAQQPQAPGASQYAPQTGMMGEVAVSERGRLVLAYLLQHESVGPTELVSLHGSSMSTWTRELKHLEQQGLIRQQGQKRFITEAGRHFAVMQ